MPLQCPCGQGIQQQQQRSSNRSPNFPWGNLSAYSWDILPMHTQSLPFVPLASQSPKHGQTCRQLLVQQSAQPTHWLPVERLCNWHVDLFGRLTMKMVIRLPKTNGKATNNRETIKKANVTLLADEGRLSRCRQFRYKRNLQIQQTCGCTMAQETWRVPCNSSIASNGNNNVPCK